MEFITSELIYHPSTINYLLGMAEGKLINNIINRISRLKEVKVKVVLPWHIKQVIATDDELAELFFASDHVELPIVIQSPNKIYTRMANYEFTRGFVLLSSYLGIEVKIMDCLIDYHLFDYDEMMNYYVVLKSNLLEKCNLLERYYFDSPDFLHGLFMAHSYDKTVPLFEIHSIIPINLKELIKEVSSTIAWEQKYKQLIDKICTI